MGILTGLLISLAVLLSTGSAAAQDKVMLLHDPRVDQGVLDDVSEALSGFRSVGSDRFVEAAESQRLDPLSDAAFSRALPAGFVDVAVVLVPARRVLNMVLRSGRNGTVLSEHTLRVKRGKLARKALKSIPRFVQAAMAKLPPSAEKSAREPDPLPEEQPESASYDEPVAEDRAEPASEEEPSEGVEEVDAAAASDPVEAEEPRLLRLHVDLGTGLATRNLEFPIEAGLGTVAVGPSAVFDIGLEAAYTPQSALSWGLQLRYQTTVGARIDEHPIGGVDRPMGIRSARFEALLVPTLALSEVVQLRLGVGYALRGLRTDVHDQALSTIHSVQTPDFTLSGPVARIALRFALGDSVALTLAPEAQLLMSVGSDLKQRGVEGSGFALGGVASVVIKVSPLLSLYLAYREAHARIAGVSGHANVRDGERFISAGLRGAP